MKFLSSSSSSSSTSSPTTLAAVTVLLLSSTVQGFLVARPPPTSLAASLVRRTATSLHNSDAFLPRQQPAVTPSRSTQSGLDADSLQARLFVDDSRQVILFDGDCGFCSDVVNLLINFDGDPRGTFRFASLQGEIGQELLKSNRMDTEHFDSIVVVEKDRVFTESDAVLLIADRLKQPIPQLASLAKILPVDWRDSLYHFVSTNRHLLAGEKDSCRIPSESEMERFLD